MKKINTILVICILITSICGCGKKNNNSEVTSIKIGVSIYDEYDTFVSNLADSIQSWAKQQERNTNVVINMEVLPAASSQMTQNDQIEEFIDQGVDVLCINLVDRTDASTIIDKAKAANVPIVFFNRELVEEDLESWNKLYYVGAEPEESGHLQGEIIVEACEVDFDNIDKNKDGVLQYVMIEGEAGHQDAFVRTERSVSTVIEAGYELEKLGDETANWNRAQAKTKMDLFIEKYSDEIEVVFANDDDMALGALDSLTDNEDLFTHMPIVVGVNGIEEALNKVKSKEMAGTVYNNYKTQASAIGTLAYYLAIKEPFPDSVELKDNKYVYIPYEKITYDNVQSYIRMLE